MKSILMSALLILTACASPTARIQPQIVAFKERHPGQFTSFQGPNRQMHFAWMGDPSKPPLIFVHGSPGAWDGWVEFLMNEDLQRRFHIIAVDRPGYGGSGEGVSEPSLKLQAQDVASVLQFNRSGAQATLVGHSYGGAVIAQIAVDNPEKIASLVFVASSLDPSLEEKKWFQFPASWWPFRLLIPNALRVCNEEIMALKGELEVLKNRWSEVKASVATIQGDADELVPPGNQDFLLSKIPAAQIRFKERVPGMNHFVPWEHSELILRALAPSNNKSKAQPIAPSK